MLHELDDTTSLWLQGPVTNWREWPGVATTIDKSGVVTKVSEDKLARDVDDLSAIFEELADGVVDFPLPCDDDDDDDDAFAALTTTTTTNEKSDDELATGTAVGNWLDGLDSDDALNVDAISEAFDALVAEQELAMSEAAITVDNDDDDDDEAMVSESEYETDDDDDDDAAVSMTIVPTAPTWATMAPLDPRSVIKTSVFANLDSRIPRIAIPRIDLAFAAAAAVASENNGKQTTTGNAPMTRPVGPFAKCLSPLRAHDKTTAAAAAAMYRHDAATCWICKSETKTPEKKRALHRFLEKRSRRNWKKGPRYSGRSNVAASRVRNGGRFIQTTQWI